MQGKIIRGVGGFYYVHAEDGNVYECRAKGIFRREKVKPLVGDNVEISVVPDNEKLAGNVDRLLKRKNSLIRPAAANVDQALVIFAAESPKPNLNLLDRFLINMQQQDIPVIVCFNKMDLVDQTERARFQEIYENCVCKVLFISVEKRQGIDEVRAFLRGKTTVVAGPSGVGKSSLTNTLQSGIHMETGSVSEKIDRGRHTTRHTELIPIEEHTYFLDTPGFSSLYVQGIEFENLRDYFPEFVPHEPYCRFQGCVHISEPDCGVKEAVEGGEIAKERYESYVLLAQEIKDKRKY